MNASQIDRMEVTVTLYGKRGGKTHMTGSYPLKGSGTPYEVHDLQQNVERMASQLVYAILFGKEAHAPDPTSKALGEGSPCGDSGRSTSSSE